MRMARLGDMCAIRSGGTPSRSIQSYYGGTIPWAKISDIEASDGEIFQTEENITDSGLAAIRGRLFPKGTLLFSIYGSIGKMAFCGRSVATNQAILGIETLSKSEVEPRYLYRYLEACRDTLINDGIGVTQKNLSAGYVRDLKIPLPPLPEQRRIAGILDQADALRRKRAEALSRLSALGQAIFFEMFVEGASATWQRSTIADVVDASAGGIRTGPFGSQLLHSEFTDDGIAVLGIDNAVSNTFRWAKERYISPEKYKALRRYKVHPGDVLITIMGTCGRCAIVPESVGEAINTKHLCCISLQKSVCLPEYLHAYFLNHPDALNHLGIRAKGAIMDGLNMGIIKDMPLTVPPIDLQHSFANRLGRIAACWNDYNSAGNDAESLFASLQHRAFRGEL